MFTYAYFIQRLRNNSLQNLWIDYFDDIDWVYHINTALIFIYNYMNSNGTWYHSNVYQTLTAASPGTNVFTLTYPLSRIWRVENSSWEALKPNNVNVALLNRGREDWYAISASNQITTKDNYTELKIWYQRLPNWADYTDLQQTIDLPETAIWVLEFFVLWRIFPIHLEQWAALANNYYQQALESLEIYAKNIGMLSENDAFITADQFNNEQRPEVWSHRWK